MIRVVLPAHLRTLAHVGEREVVVAIEGEATLLAVLDALEARFPQLRGTIRDRASGARRPYVRYFACKRDLSHVSPETPLPNEVCEGREPLLIVGAMAGG